LDLGLYNKFIHIDHLLYLLGLAAGLRNVPDLERRAHLFASESRLSPGKIVMETWSISNHIQYPSGSITWPLLWICWYVSFGCWSCIWSTTTICYPTIPRPSAVCVRFYVVSSGISSDWRMNICIIVASFELRGIFTYQHWILDRICS